jgi:hypothetical protein
MTNYIKNLLESKALPGVTSISHDIIALNNC